METIIGIISFLIISVFLIGVFFYIIHTHASNFDEDKYRAELIERMKKEEEEKEKRKTLEEFPYEIKIIVERKKRP